MANLVDVLICLFNATTYPFHSFFMIWLTVNMGISVDEREDRNNLYDRDNLYETWRLGIHHKVNVFTLAKCFSVFQPFLKVSM